MDTEPSVKIFLNLLLRFSSFLGAPVRNLPGGDFTNRGDCVMFFSNRQSLNQRFDTGT
jgi:hypothetical protein